MANSDAASVPSGPYLVAAGGFWTKAGVEALIEENQQLQARIGVLLYFARPVDVQAAQRHITEHGFVDEEGNPL